MTSGTTLAIAGGGWASEVDWTQWFPDRHVHVVALPTGTSDELAHSAPSLVELNSDVIVVQVSDVDFTLRRTVEHAVRNVQYLMATLRRGLAGSRLLTLSIVPMSSATVQDSQDANRHLRQFSHTLGAQFLDLSGLLGPNGALRPDLLDEPNALSADGYEAWMSELRAALERVESAPPMTRPTPVVTPVDGPSTSMVGARAHTRVGEDAIREDIDTVADGLEAKAAEQIEVVLRARST